MIKKLLTFVVLVGLFTALPAFGQSIQNFVHDAGEYKIYQRIGNAKSVTWVTTIKVKDQQCKRLFVSPVKITDNRIVFRGGTVWKLQATDSGIAIEFPQGKKLEYEPTEINPLRYCKKGKEI